MLNLLSLKPRADGIDPDRAMGAVKASRRSARAHLGACLLFSASLLLVAAPAPPARADTPATPIPQAATSMAPGFIGAPARPNPLYEPVPPQNPFMALDGRSEIHDDAYQSDTNQLSGPLGRDTRVLSTFQGGDCASVTFDAQGRILSVCVRPEGPTLYMFDPRTLATLASFALPPKMPGGPGLTNPFQDFTGGGYFYLDNHDRVVVSTNDRHVYVISETAGPGFALTRDYNVSALLGPSDRLTSALPDWRGRIWVESFDGVLVTIDPATGAMRSLKLGEETENSFAIDETGSVYVVSIKALYRLQAARDGTPRVVWRTQYPNSGIHEPGQVDAGSGTTPTVQNGYITITDNADPLDVAVYRRTDGHPVCLQPIFTKGASADENSLIGAGNVMIAENNYGYSGPKATENGALTAPGIERVDINPGGRGCHVVWLNTTERVPTVVSKLSLANGLIYTYTKDDPSRDDPWYFAALDVRSGRVVFKRLAGTGLGYNNNYAPVTLGPDGTAYVGVLGGLVALRDAVAPNLPAPRPPGRATRPRARHSNRLVLRLTRLRGHRLRVFLTGGARRSIRRATFIVRVRDRRLRRASRPTRLGATFRLGGLRGGTRLRIVARVQLRNGARLRLTRIARVKRRSASSR